MWRKNRKFNIILLCFLATNVSASSANTDMQNNNTNVNDIDIVVLIGASYARGMSLEDIEGKKFINKGVNGDHTNQMLNRFKNDVIDLKPATVIIWGFINDLHDNDMGRAENTKKQIRLRYQEMVKLARDAKISPILATELTIRLKDGGLMYKVKNYVASLLNKPRYFKIINAHVEETNAWIKHYAKEEGVRVMDFGAALVTATGERAKQYSLADGSHISPKGYSVLESIARTEIKSLK